MKRTKILRAIIALLLCCGTLLLFDLSNRKTIVKEKMIRIATFKICSRMVLDEIERGVLVSLKERGFVNGKNCIIQKFSAEGDMAVANMIANNIVNGSFDYVVTASTPALQVMANANKKGKVMHIFCGVTDPYVSGVGISGANPDQHPPHLVGVGSFQPVERAFDIAHQMNPKLKKVGTVWCTSETCSEACVRLARKKCKAMGIELMEMSVENATQILESAMSLTARGAEALWLGGDNVVETGIDQLINAAGKANVPLFTNSAYNVYGTNLFGIGAEYYEVGRLAGNLTADIIDGKPTSEIRVDNVVPENLKVNPKALKNLKSLWSVSGFESYFIP
jgi:ABC-type uncharacterized transport system substrate-binding protein